MNLYHMIYVPYCTYSLQIERVPTQKAFERDYLSLAQLGAYVTYTLRAALILRKEATQPMEAEGRQAGLLYPHTQENRSRCISWPGSARVTLTHSQSVRCQFGREEREKKVNLLLSLGVTLVSSFEISFLWLLTFSYWPWRAGGLFLLPSFLSCFVSSFLFLRALNIWSAFFFLSVGWK